MRGGEPVVIPLKEMSHDLEAIHAAVDEKTRLIFLDNPNNPCGTLITAARFNEFLDSLPEGLIVALDEAYVHFVEPEERIDVLELIRRDTGPSVVALRTFSKAFGLAGLRVGYGLMHPEIADILQRVRQPFNINLPAQAGCLAALQDQEYYDRVLTGTREGRKWLSEQVAQLGCRAYPSHTNFFLIDVRGDATALYEAMLHKGIIIRSMKAYGFTTFIRVTVGTQEENSRFINGLGQCLRELGYV
jgi:histidinol-phosphate aminotransferase